MTIRWTRAASCAACLNTSGPSGHPKRPHPSLPKSWRRPLYPCAIADERNRPFDRVAAADGGGSLMLGRGEPADAVIILDESFALAEAHGVRLFVPVIGCQRGIAYLEQERIDAAGRILACARAEAKTVGYGSLVLRASIDHALALSRDADVQVAPNSLREARGTARQQGSTGLEAEALFSAEDRLARLGWPACRNGEHDAWFRGCQFRARAPSRIALLSDSSQRD